MNPPKITQGLRLIMLTCVLCTPTFAADNAALEKRIDELSQELAALKLQVQQQSDSHQATAPVKTTGETKTVTDVSSAAVRAPEEELEKICPHTRSCAAAGTGAPRGR